VSDLVAKASGSEIDSGPDGRWLAADAGLSLDGDHRGAVGGGCQEVGNRAEFVGAYLGDIHQNVDIGRTLLARSTSA
jgi:hypothetical protein